MKRTIVLCFLAVSLLTGCAALERLDSVQSQAEKLLEPGLESAAMATIETVPGLLTPEEVRDLALTHAGLTLGQISRLRTEYELEDGLPRYEVEFHQGQREYHYEIDARTGEILEHEREH
nr:PepSY domain-containing protein [Oscillospiraceae bacterium]